jgi:SOS response regulatory protein OraA/RecX
MGATLYEKTMQRALRLLSYKARTIEEMRRRLLENEWAEAEVVEQVRAAGSR